MEKKEAEYRTLFKQVSPSIVIVEQPKRTDYFCIGSIISTEGDNTFILTQFKVAASSKNLSVCFSNGFKQPTSLLVRLGNKLCILVTKFYAKCKALDFFEGDIDHIHVGAIAPASRSSVYDIPGFVIQKSRESGCHDDEDKGDYFTFTCQYGDSSANRVSRLISGPVFSLKAQVLGVVTGDMGVYHRPLEHDGTIIHEELYYQLGFNLKAAVSASNLQASLRELTGCSNWHDGLKQMAMQAKEAA